MRRFFTAVFYPGLLLLICLTNQTTARGDPITISNVKIAENGNDVIVTLVVTDSGGRNAISTLPRNFTLSLFDNGVFVKSIVVPVNDANASATGYVTNPLTFTIPDASRAARGVGGAANYTVTLAPTPVPTPEPATLLLLSTGLAGVAIKTRKRFKNRKSG